MKSYAVIFNKGARYGKLAKCAVDSFKKHNPDTKLFYINDSNLTSYASQAEIVNTPVGILKYIVAMNVGKQAMKQEKDRIKLIILGADTITCSRLDEFLDNDKEDILGTLDYPYQFASQGVYSPNSETHLNADVVCFNNIMALKDVIECGLKHRIYFEQGGLNEVVWSGRYGYSIKIVDDFQKENVIYNARAKGNITAKTNEKPWKPYIQKYTVKNDKLYAWNGKQLKVWHYCDGLGTLPDNRFVDTINWWINSAFNQETKNFFTNVCDCGDFFTRDFNL